MTALGIVFPDFSGDTNSTLSMWEAGMDKARLVQAIIAHFELEHQVAERAAKANYEAATHEENRAENKYDTRGLEASYMAASQGKRALDLQQTCTIYKSMKMSGFDKDSEIGMTALVTLEDGQEQRHFFLGPRGGGARIELDGCRITIITAAAPLGRQMLGKTTGDTVADTSGRTWEIVTVT